MESWRGVGWIKFKSFLCTVTLDKSLNLPMMFPFLSVKTTLCGNALEMKELAALNSGAWTEGRAVR